ncbi:MAG TPA: YaeQ family protein [Steroidobacteraceae bacterium]
MALGATIYVFEVRLADADRGVYETLTLRVARHPSETAEFLLTRLLAYCLEYTEGIAFSKGLSDPDEPALGVRDLTGALQSWIEVGTPDADRLHKAAKAAPDVAVYAHRDVDSWLARLSGERIHRAGALRIRAVDRELLAALVARLERRMSFDLAVSDLTLYLTLGDETLTGAVVENRLEGA